MKIHKKTKRMLSIFISALTMVNAVILPLESNLSLPEFKVSAAETEGVAINEENFPDPIFRDYVSIFDINKNNVLSDVEIDNITSVNVNKNLDPPTPDNEKIETLEGIEHFTSLTTLYCINNKLKTLDLSNNTELTGLWCYDNQLTREPFEMIESGL